MFSGYASANSTTEYNVWHKHDGILNDIALTDEGQPVLINLAFPGAPDQNMMVSFAAAGACPTETENDNVKFMMDNRESDATFECYSIDEYSSIHHFTIYDHVAVDYFHRQMTSGTTVIIQGKIKAWVSNYNQPKPGYPTYR